jgi:hypothetical protein
MGLVVLIAVIAVGCGVVAVMPRRVEALLRRDILRT